MTAAVETLNGSITSVGFDSGHRFVIGHWPESPIGSFADVMWRDPRQVKRLIARLDAAHYVTSVYPFDTCVEADVEVRITPGPSRWSHRLEIDAGPVRLDLTTGRWTIPFPPRPRLITATVERAMARAMFGVTTHGRSPTGVEEWYRTRSVQRVVSAVGTLNGVDLGNLAPIDPPVEFGFSDPLGTPTHVRLRVDLRRPDTRA